jgi:polar amino acid transport system substrate-binding protein
MGRRSAKCLDWIIVRYAKKGLSRNGARRGQGETAFWPVFVFVGLEYTALNPFMADIPMSPRALWLFLALSCVTGAAAAQSGNAREIVFVAATNHAMPLSQFQNGILTGGVLKDLGDAIAARLGRSARFINVPPKRVSLVLADGSADSVCYVRPAWLEGSFKWSKPFIPAGGVLVARNDAPVVKTIAELANIPVGTVAGYSYQNMDAALGKSFVREDAPFMESNMQKLELGRMQYAIMEKLTFNYLARSKPRPKVRIDIEFESFKAQCAFSEKSQVPFVEVERAINSMIEDRSFDRLMARYR